MKKIRLTAFILSLASCLFLFSAGFSTWFKVVLPTDIDPATGEFTAYSVVDVVSSGTVTSNIEYTSFDFVSGKNTITVKYTFTSATRTKVSLGYENLSAYAGTDFSGLFTKIVSDSENPNNSIGITITNCDISSITVSSTDKSKIVSNNGSDEIVFYITPQSANTITPQNPVEVIITYTFNIDSTENKGNFRQNMGKYLMAGKDGKYTKFISTVVAAS